MIGLFILIAILFAVVLTYALNVPDVALPNLLPSLTTGTAVQPYTMHLFTNNVTPNDANVLSDFTEVTTTEFTGYAAQSISGWGAPTVASHVAISTANTLTWQPSSNPASPVIIYGYFVTDTNGNLAWAERFSTGPVTITLAAQSVSIVPALTLKSQF